LIICIKQVTFYNKIVLIVTNPKPMKKLVQILKTHYWALIAYVLYAWICSGIISSELKYKAAFNNTKGGDRIGWGESVEYGIIFLTIIAIIFTIIIALNALVRETGKSFYWWLCLFIIIPVVIAINVK